MPQDAFRIGFVPGVMPDKWLCRWRERMPGSPLHAFPVTDREQTAVLADGRAQMCFVREPLEREGLHVVRLYDEEIVVVLSTEHLLSVLDEVHLADLEDQLCNTGDPGTAILTAAAGTGVAVVPASLARLHRRKDLTTRPLVDAPAAAVALAWRRDLDDERAETFLGIVRGRTANSSRGTALPSTPTRPKTTRNRHTAQRRSGRGRRRR